MSDEDEYIRRNHVDEPAAETEDDETTTPPKKRLALLRQIAADIDQPYAIRHDARRLIERADIRPNDFAAEFAEFESWRRQFNTGTRDE